MLDQQQGLAERASDRSEGLSRTPPALTALAKHGDDGNDDEDPKLAPTVAAAKAAARDADSARARESAEVQRKRSKGAAAAASVARTGTGHAGAIWGACDTTVGVVRRREKRREREGERGGNVIARSAACGSGSSSSRNGAVLRVSGSSAEPKVRSEQRVRFRRISPSPLSRCAAAGERCVCACECGAWCE